MVTKKIYPIIVSIWLWNIETLHFEENLERGGVFDPPNIYRAGLEVDRYPNVKFSNLSTVSLNSYET